MSANIKEAMLGSWSGHIVSITIAGGEKIELATDQGVRGINIPVTVTVESGKWSVAHNGRPVTVTGIRKAL